MPFSLGCIGLESRGDDCVSVLSVLGFLQMEVLKELDGHPGFLTKAWVPHISLVFREMWDATAPSL